MDRNRPDDPDTGIIDDKKAEAQERIGRIQKSGAPSVEAQPEAEDAEDRISEREEIDQAARP